MTDASEPPAASSAEGRGDRSGLWIGLVLALASALPALVVRFPQMSDYPAHLARYHVMLDAGRSTDLAGFYTFAWKWGGNLGVDLLIGPLAGLFGLENAGRIIVALIPVLTGLGILAVEWQLRRRIGPGSLLAFAFIWSPSLLLGLVNFGLGLALALLVFALWIRLEGRPWRWAPFLPLAVVVWLCHVSAWGILGIAVFGYEWHNRKSIHAFVAPWPLTLPFLPLLFGMGGSGGISWGKAVLNYKTAIWMRGMRDRVLELDFLSLGLVAALVLWALSRRRIDGRLGWAALIMLAGSIAMPRHIFGGDYADYRLISSGLLFACLAIDWPAPPRWTLWAASLLFAARLAVTTQAWHAESRETERFVAMLDAVPTGARVASAVAVERGVWAFNTHEHVCGYAVVRRDALSNCNFAVPGVHMLGLRDGMPGFTDPSQRIFVASGQGVDLSHFAPARDMDYLWYVGQAEVTALPPGATVIRRAPHSLLARLAKRSGDR